MTKIIAKASSILFWIVIYFFSCRVNSMEMDQTISLAEITWANPLVLRFNVSEGETLIYDDSGFVLLLSVYFLAIQEHSEKVYLGQTSWNNIKNLRLQMWPEIKGLLDKISIFMQNHQFSSLLRGNAFRQPEGPTLSEFAAGEFPQWLLQEISKRKVLVVEKRYIDGILTAINRGQENIIYNHAGHPVLSTFASRDLLLPGKWVAKTRSLLDLSAVLNLTL